MSVTCVATANETLQTLLAGSAIQASTGDAAMCRRWKRQVVARIVAAEWREIGDRRVEADRSEEARGGIFAVLLEVGGEARDRIVGRRDELEHDELARQLVTSTSPSPEMSMAFPVVNG